MELSQGIAAALLKLERIEIGEVISIGLKEAAEKWAGGYEFGTETGFASK